MSWLIAVLFVSVFAALWWALRDGRDEQEQQRRRTAEERLRDVEARNVRRIERDEEKP